MTQLSPFETKLLNEINERRKIGKRGLPLNLIRDEQIKVRFTESDRAVIDSVSRSVGTNEAQFLYTLAISSVREMMINDPVIAVEIKRELNRVGVTIPQWMREL
ncbi:hypothetical protein [Photobacterium damselae]|uniref:hypothetical protein n=1 Tax=Photobacterium damselae TaxID=38293 RepID=UPI000D6605ED|nr:hypothetical protein [Photobacterium damselae]AWK83852.1 hypothetical protein BST98_17760 [Photobacterium damselae]SUB90644.1 Uncharacterised protein [Photobacterium damselae]